MPTKTFGLRQADHSEKISPVNRVPLEALQMLTQSVSKCNQDYIQPLPLKVQFCRIALLDISCVETLYTVVLSLYTLTSHTCFLAKNLWPVLAIILTLISGFFLDLTGG